jgi:MFS family permease
MAANWDAMAANASPGRSRAAVTVVFFVNGAVFSSLFARLPAIKADLGLGDGELGLALLFATFGLLATQLAAGALAVRSGSASVVRVAAPLYCVALAAPALAPDGETFALGLLLLGAANGALDVAMNVQGAAIERRYGRPLMSSFHAAFSFGALAGAGAAALVAAAGVGSRPHLVTVGGIALAAMALAGHRLDESWPPAQRRGPLVARPSRSLVALGALAFCVLLAEGSVGDWSAVYMRESVGSSQALAAAGLAVFSLTMGIGRLIGDRLAAAVGPDRLVRSGALLASAGLGLAIASEWPGAAMVGFAAMGAGLSTAFPLVVSAAATRAGVAPAAAIAAVSTTGYAGFMAGPPLIGLLAEVSSLRVALLLPAVLCLVAIVLAPATGARRSPGRPAS